MLVLEEDGLDFLLWGGSNYEIDADGVIKVIGEVVVDVAHEHA